LVVAISVVRGALTRVDERDHALAEIAGGCALPCL
jgi:hypothetical protein